MAGQLPEIGRIGVQDLLGVAHQDHATDGLVVDAGSLAGVIDAGDLVAGGRFWSIAGVNANRIARYDGTSWHDMGGGISGEQSARNLQLGGLGFGFGDYPACEVDIQFFQLSAVDLPVMGGA